MLDTRLCSPLILPDSAPGAWVEENFSPNNTGSGNSIYISEVFIHYITELAPQQEPSDFRPSQFACQSQWCQQIALHWRLKDSLKCKLHDIVM